LTEGRFQKACIGVAFGRSRFGPPDRSGLDLGQRSSLERDAFSRASTPTQAEPCLSGTPPWAPKHDQTNCNAGEPIMWEQARSRLRDWYIVVIAIAMIAGGFFLASHQSSSTVPAAAVGAADTPPSSEKPSPPHHQAAAAAPPAAPSILHLPARAWPDCAPARPSARQSARA